VTPDGRHAISASSDHTLKVWDLGTGAELRTLSGHTSVVRAVAVTPDGRRAVSASFDETVKTWDLETGLELHTLAGHGDLIVAVTAMADGRRVVSGSLDHTLKVWDVATGMQLRTLAGHRDEVRAVEVTPDACRSVSSSVDQTMRLWDTDTGEELSAFTGHGRGMNAVAVTPDGRRALSVFGDGMLDVYDLTQMARTRGFRTDSGPSACAVAPVGTGIVAGDSGGRVYILQLENVPPGPPIISAWFAPGDSTPAFGCLHCRVWSEVPTSALSTELPCPHCGKAVKLNPFVIEADWRPVAAAWRGDP